MSSKQEEKKGIRKLKSLEPPKTIESVVNIFSNLFLIISIFVGFLAISIQISLANKEFKNAKEVFKAQNTELEQTKNIFEIQLAVDIINSINNEDFQNAYRNLDALSDLIVHQKIDTTKMNFIYNCEELDLARMYYAKDINKIFTNFTKIYLILDIGLTTQETICATIGDYTASLHEIINNLLACKLTNPNSQLNAPLREKMLMIDKIVNEFCKN